MAVLSWAEQGGVVGVDCVTSDHLAYACTFNAVLVDFLTTLLQGVWVVVGAVVAVAVSVSFSVLWKRLG